MRDKEFFVRHLVAEGFVPESYGRRSDQPGELFRGIEWCIEDNSVNDSAAELPQACATRFMIRLIVCACILWGIELACLIMLSQ